MVYLYIYIYICILYIYILNIYIYIIYLYIYIYIAELLPRPRGATHAGSFVLEQMVPAVKTSCEKGSSHVCPKQDR